MNIKHVNLLRAWEDQQNRRTEYEIQFTVVIPRSDLLLRKNLGQVCEQAVKLLMPDPRRSDLFPLFGNHF